MPARGNGLPCISVAAGIRVQIHYIYSRRNQTKTRNPENLSSHPSLCFCLCLYQNISMAESHISCRVLPPHALHSQVLPHFIRVCSSLHTSLLPHFIQQRFNAFFPETPASPISNFLPPFLDLIFFRVSIA